MGTIALIGLGSNLGDRKVILDAAVAALAETPGIEVRAVSSYHETLPVGGPPGQGLFLNAAIALDSSISATNLHVRLRELEQQAGRVRVVRWGERTLDLDLLLFGNEVHETRDLEIPHPRMFFRRFVMVPVVEVAASVIDPLSNRSMAKILESLNRRPSYVAVHRPDIHEASGLATELAATLKSDLVSMHEIRTARSSFDKRAALMSKVVESFAADISASLLSSVHDWVVSDFWLDGFYHWAIPRLEPGGRSLDEFKRRFSEARQAIPIPMMVVFPNGQGPRRPAWADHLSSIDPYHASPSLLHIQNGHEDEGLAEVLAACASSRPDGRIA